MGSERCLALIKLVKDNEMLSEIEVASVVVPLLERLRSLHAAGRAHGNVSISTVTIRVAEPSDGTIHLLDPECCTAHRSCAACQQVEHSAASDVYSVGNLALQLLLGRPCREEGHAPLVDPHTGELPMLPRGCSLDCIDFLMDCLALNPDDRSSAVELLKHSFLFSITSPSGPALADSLADSLADCLLISAERRQQAPACRPGFVPSLKGKRRVCFTSPSHTERCQHCHCQFQCGHHQQQAARCEDHVRLQVNGLPLVADREQHTPTKTSPSSNTSKSAASTKRKAGSPCPDQPDSTPKRKRSGLVKYLSPAMLPMRSDFVNAPALLLE